MASVNPFRIGGSVTGEYFTDRAETVQRIAAALAEPQAKLLVYGPRRMGKTSALEVAVARAQRNRQRAAVVDFSAATTVTDMANRILQAASPQLKQGPRGWLESFLGMLRFSVQVQADPVTGAPQLSVGAERRQTSVEEQRRTLGDVLDALDSLAGERGTTFGLVIDEFQEIHRFGGADAQWHLRSVMQKHKNLSYVCAGSQESLIREMMGAQGAFFKLFETHYLGPIDPEHLARWIESRMQGAGVRGSRYGARVVDLAGPRTRDVVQLARACFDVAAPAGEVRPGDVERAFRRVIDEEDDVRRSEWSQLTPLQQNLLRAVAAGAEQLTGADARARFGLSASGSVVPALESLQQKDIIARGEDGYAFDSPFMRGWVTIHALPDVGIHLDPAAPPCPESQQ
jgi:hypothetical protein